MCVTVYYQDALIYASSTLTKQATKSSKESELRALNKGIEGIKRILPVLARAHAMSSDPRPLLPIHAFTDNYAAVAAIQRGSLRSSTRYMDRRCCYIMDAEDEGITHTRHIHGDVNPADIGTKPLAETRFAMLRELLGVHPESHFLNICEQNPNTQHKSEDNTHRSNKQVAKQTV
jgi:hypothetical protein